MGDKPRFQLTVHKTRGVKAIGKQGKNDLYAVVVFGNEKHKTSVIERCIDACWEQNCHLTLKGNESGSVIVKVCHRNFLLSSDELIGSVEVFLEYFTFYESPKTSWFQLQNKKANTEAEIQLTLTYLAILPASLDTSPKNSLMGLAQKLQIGKDHKKQRNESLCDLTKKDTEADKELSGLQIMPTDLKCLYYSRDSEEEKETDAGNGDEEGEEEAEIRRPKKVPALTADNMVDLGATRRHSIAMLNKRECQELSIKDNNRHSLRPELSSVIRLPSTPNIFIEQGTKDPSERQESLNDASYSEPSQDNPTEQTYKKIPTFSFISFQDDEECSEQTTVDRVNVETPDSKPSTQKAPINDEERGKENKIFGDSCENINNGSNKHEEILKETKDDKAIKSVERMNSRNLLISHYNDFSKQELVQLVLDQREWIKARELYILEIEEYQKKLLLKVLDQSSKGGAMKRGVRSSIVEEINMGVNQVLQRQRLHSERGLKAKVEGKSLAKKWFGALFKNS